MLTSDAMPSVAQLNGVDRAREAAQRVVNPYTAWNATDPTNGYDQKDAEWKAKLDAAVP